MRQTKTEQNILDNRRWVEGRGGTYRPVTLRRKTRQVRQIRPAKRSRFQVIGSSLFYFLVNINAGELAAIFLVIGLIALGVYVNGMLNEAFLRSCEVAFSPCCPARLMLTGGG